MSTSKLQKLYIHTHNGKRLFHVSVHNRDTKTGTNWKSVAGKTKCVYKNLLNGKRSNNERTLTAGLAIAMVNTNFEGWETVEYPGEYHIAEALDYKNDLIEQYEEAGYTNVGIRTISSKRDPNHDGSGTNWTKSFNISGMKKEKIYSKIDFINNSLQMKISDSIKHQAYRAVVKENSEVDNLASLLKFLREKMNVTEVANI